eukprot:CAMPEP_0170175716 /NCGR_PEP_ID=MMETSP0040_2-20121228/8737_1 /TAXON_ID=641309 /ORGANISM="Lotharella oceanica, Strain CCMP622" /LENGTH=324 /DNA_ID=CAMNT_0010417789 /DNA_START=660 /DNA_END=1634 /DNA_ORIENTATION=+
MTITTLEKTKTKAIEWNTVSKSLSDFGRAPVTRFHQYWDLRGSEYEGHDTTEKAKLLKFMRQVRDTDDYSYQNPFGADDTENALDTYSEFPKDAQKRIYALCQRSLASKQKLYAVDILNAVHPKAELEKAPGENSEKKEQDDGGPDTPGTKRSNSGGSTDVASSSEPPSKKQKVECKSDAGAKGKAKSWTLSSKRKVKLDHFKGRLLINIREFYDKDGEAKPGRKGIALTPDQWSKLYERMGELDEKLQKGELTDWVLSAKRKARVTKFKDRILMDIREVYTKDGKELPAKKGISLTTEQWKKLVEASKSIDEAVKRELSTKAT